MSSMLQFLSRRIIGIGFLIVSILAINSWQLLMPDLSFDNSFSIVAAKNLTEGHGYSTKMTRADDLSGFYYQPLNKWPPGYSWLLIVVRELMGTDWIRAAFILNAFGLMALILVFRKILLQLELPIWLINTAILIFGLIPHAFTGEWFSDIFGVLFFVVGISLLLHFIKMKRRRVWPVLLAAIAFSFCAYLKYLYLIMVFIPMICLYWYGHKLHEKPITQSAKAGFLVLFTGLACLLIYQFQHTGKAVYINSTTWSFFPEQLLALGPLFPASFLNLNFYNMQIMLHSNLSYIDVGMIWRFINLVCLIWVVSIFVAQYRKKAFVQSGFQSFYLQLSGMLLAGFLLFLGSLSITQSRFYTNHSPWTYIQELRYFGVISLIIFSWSCILILSARKKIGNRRLFIFRFLFLMLMIIEVSHDIYYISKKMFVEKAIGLRKYSEQVNLTAMAIAHREMAKNETVVVCSNTAEILNFCGLEDVAGLDDINLLNSPLHSSRPIVLLIILYQKDLHLIQPFLLSDSTHLETEVAGVNYYITRIPKPKLF